MNPPAASLYRNGAEGFGAEVASTGIDYESTLSACPRSTIVTPDGAFQAVASEYGLTDQIVGTAPIPEAAALAAAVERVSTAGLTTVFSEPFADNSTINALAIAAITLWNTVYLERAVNALRERGAVDDALLGHIAPLGWNHIGLTGDYNWHANKRVAKGGFRPLRRVRSMESTGAAP